MEYRRLGTSGLKLSELSFGSWVTIGTQADGRATEQMMHTAYAAGVNFFDGAEGYNRGVAENLMGAALKKLSWRRDSYCVSSKVFFGAVDNPGPTQLGLSRKHVFDACHQALQRWGLDYLDLYFCHRADPDTPIEETVRAMDDLIRQGKVMYWGTSEWTAQEITEAWAIARREHLAPPTMEQPQYNLLDRQRFEQEYARLYGGDIGLGTTIWSPLASGVLTGKYLNGVPEGSRVTLPGYEWLRKRAIDSDRGQRRLDQVRNLLPICDELGIPMTRLAIAWCLRNPNVSTVILGASRVEQLEETLTAAEVVPLLTDEVCEKIDAALGFAKKR